MYNLYIIDIIIALTVYIKYIIYLEAYPPLEAGSVHP